MSHGFANQTPLSTDPALAASVAPVVMLTPEQTRAKMVELRDAEGKSIGFLYREAGHAVYYSPEYIAELQRRAASGERGKTLRELLDAVAAKMSAQQPKA